MLDTTHKNGRHGIQVIARAAAILRALESEQGGMSLGQIADAVDLPRSTVQRIVAALQTERLVASNLRGGGLRLGPAINALAEATRYNTVERCRLLLTELSLETGETADLSVMRGVGMVFLDQVPGTHRLRTVSSVGEVFPLTTTANGRACLAQIPAPAAQKLVQDEWTRRGQSGDLQAFMAELNDIRADGLAYDLDEHTNGISAVGFAMPDLSGEVHAISVPVPSTRFAEVQSTVETALRRTALHAAKILGTTG